MGKLKDQWIRAIEDGREEEFLESVGASSNAQDKPETASEIIGGVIEGNEMIVKPSAREIMNTSQTLAGLAAKAVEITRMLLECGGELSPELEEELDVNQQLLAKKTDGYNFIIEEMEAQASIWRRRKDACAKQQRKFESEIERLRKRIKDALNTMGKKEIQGDYYRFQIRKCRPKLMIEDEDLLPAEFKMIVQTQAVDTDKLLSALLAGFEVPGARLQEDGALYSLEVTERE
jgi:hypothetical protein